MRELSSWKYIEHRLFKITAGYLQLYKNTTVSHSVSGPCMGQAQLEKEDTRRWQHCASCSKSKDEHNSPAGECYSKGSAYMGYSKSTRVHVQTNIACSHQGDARFKHSWVLGKFGWKTTWLRSTSHCSQVPSPDLIENNGKTPGEQSRS